jgi:hypothetical protein
MFSVSVNLSSGIFIKHKHDRITITMNKTKQPKKKHRSKIQSSKKVIKRPVEKDSTFFLKLTVFLILGSQWIYIQNGDDWQLPIPVGLIIGIIFATHEHFIIDRKIEYVVLLFAAFISFWLPIGLLIQI